MSQIALLAALSCGKTESDSCSVSQSSERVVTFSCPDGTETVVGADEPEPEAALVPALASLVSVGGRLVVSYNESLPTLVGLEGVPPTGGELRIWTSASLPASRATPASVHEVGAKHQPSATIGDKVMLQQKLSVHALGEVWGKAVIALRTEMAQPTLHS